MSSSLSEINRTFLWNRLNNSIIWFKSETQEHESPSVTLRNLPRRLDSEIRRQSQLVYERGWSIFLQSVDAVRNVVHHLAPAMAVDKDIAFLELLAHQRSLTWPDVVDKARRSPEQ
jgi:hypothetical protein